MAGAARTALLGLALALAAETFGAGALLVPAVALIALAAVSAGWVAVVARGIEGSRKLGARSVVEDEPLAVELTVEARGLPLPGGTVEDPVLGAAWPVPAGARRVEASGAARFERRGWRELEPPRVRVRDPLGIASRVAMAGATVRVLVLPRVEPVRTVAGARRGAVGARARSALGAEIEFDGLRPHRPGSAASRIYWPGVARGVGLLERRLTPEGDGALPLVVLDPRGAARPADLDAAVRAAASLVVALARGGGCRVALPGARRTTALGRDLRGWDRLRARLAVVDGDGAPSAAACAVHGEPVIHIAPRAPSSPPPWLRRGPGRGARVLVVPDGSAAPEWSGTARVLDVAGCTGYELVPASAGRAGVVAGAGRGA